MDDKIIASFVMHRRNRRVDLVLPLDMTAHELVLALNQAYELGIRTEDLGQCYLSCENPVALLRGRRTLREIGLRDGSIVHFTR